MLLIGSAAADETYPIKLARPSKNGDKYSAIIVGTEKSRVTYFSGRDIVQEDKQDYRVEIDGDFETTSVDRNGSETGFKCTIKRCVRIDGKRETVLIEPGRTIMAHDQSGETKLRFDDGRELDKDVCEPLLLVLSTQKDGAATDDQLFGTEQHQKVGATWEPDIDKLLDEIDEFEIEPEEGESGTVKLVSVAERDGVQCVHVQADIRVPHFAGTAPEELEIQKGNMRITIAVLVPLDAQLSSPQVASQAYEMSMTLGPKDESDKEMSIEMKSTRTIQFERKARQ